MVNEECLAVKYAHFRTHVCKVREDNLFANDLIGATQHWVINYHSDVTILTHCPWEMWRLGWVKNFMGTLFSISLLSIEGYFWKSMANLLDAHSLPNHCRYNCNSDMYSNLFESYLSYRLISWVLPGKSLPCECNIIDPLMKVSIGSGNGLVPSGNKPLPGPMLAPRSMTPYAIATHSATIG